MPMASAKKGSAALEMMYVGGAMVIESVICCGKWCCGLVRDWNGRIMNEVVDSRQPRAPAMTYWRLLLGSVVVWDVCT